MRSRMKVVTAPDYSLFATEIEPYMLLQEYGGNFEHDDQRWTERWAGRLEGVVLSSHFVFNTGTSLL